MNKGARLTLVAYDIPDDRRRTRIATVLESYGDRVQYSVFLIQLSQVKVARLRRRLIELMEPGADSILICDLGVASESTDKCEFLGQSAEALRRSFVV